MKDVEAAYQLGTILSEGAKDAEAVKWLRQTGFESHSEASFRLANLYATDNLSNRTLTKPDSGIAGQERKTR